MAGICKICVSMSAGMIHLGCVTIHWSSRRPSRPLEGNAQAARMLVCAVAALWWHGATGDAAPLDSRNLHPTVKLKLEICAELAHKVYCFGSGIICPRQTQGVYKLK